MAGALPILLLGGAALMMMGGGKKTTTTGAPKKKAAPSYGKDSSSMISIYQDGSVRLGKGWESAVMDPTLESMWDIDFKDVIDTAFSPRDVNGWGYSMERYPVNPLKPYYVIRYEGGNSGYNRALNQFLNSVVVSYYGHSKMLSEFSDAYPHVKRLRSDIRQMFKEWTKDKIREWCSEEKAWNSCEIEGM